MPSRRAGAMGETGRTQMTAALCALPHAARGQAGGMDAKNEKVSDGAAHSPTPWRYTGHGWIMTADEAAEPIAALNFGGFREANALYIVEAVNAHAELARDKARLDWLQHEHCGIEATVADGSYDGAPRRFVFLADGLTLEKARHEIRAAIDEAMQPQPARKD